MNVGDYLRGLDYYKELGEDETRQTFLKALGRWLSFSNPKMFLDGVSDNEEGNPVLEYSFKTSYSNLTCKFMPLATVEWILESCRTMYEEVVKEFESNGAKAAPAWQESSKEDMAQAVAEIAVHRFMIGLRTKLCYAVEDNLREALLLAEVILRGHPKYLLEGDLEEDRIPVDFRQAIDDFVKEVSDRQREHLKGIGKNVPLLIVERGRGGDRRSGSGCYGDEDARISLASMAKHTIPLWEEITDFFEREDYDEQCAEWILKSSKFKKLSERCPPIPPDLLRDVFNRQKVRDRNHSPQAFALKHAHGARRLNDEPSYETLRKAYLAGRKLLEG